MRVCLQVMVRMLQEQVQQHQAQLAGAHEAKQQAQLVPSLQQQLQQAHHELRDVKHSLQELLQQQEQTKRMQDELELWKVAFKVTARE